MVATMTRDGFRVFPDVSETGGFVASAIPAATSSTASRTADVDAALWSSHP
jgi:hypothetical protein